MEILVCDRCDSVLNVSGKCPACDDKQGLEDVVIEPTNFSEIGPRVDVLEGDFLTGAAALLQGGWLRLPGYAGKLDPGSVYSIDEVNTATVPQLRTQVAWALGGLAIFGPAGLIAGAVIGAARNTVDVTFLMILHDRRRIVAKAPAKTLAVLRMAVATSQR
ncbi:MULTISPECIES: hypothetical protein [Luteibacter]|uniref:hypothetical protein n=1 Tax=Luteibacter TaxID=242605 RepID=UPI00055E02C2|nr:MULTISPECIES: hypothetical protein [unclassified Luteibacter]